MIVFESQSELRKQILALRSRMSYELVHVMSAEVVQKWIKLSRSISLKGKNVALYRARGSEFQLTELERWLPEQGAKIFYPRILDSKQALIDFAAVEDPMEYEWDLGPMDIEEPQPHLPAIAPDQLDLIFTPGVAFGVGGQRLGYGRGFYDRFLKNSTNALKVALAFDFQLVETFPTQTWDVPVDWIVTEQREVRTQQLQRWVTERGTRS